ncbi:hypothetical protein [Streptomyces cavernae]|uniref:hypothetical protein n=1 Tax=Streptomyces cavernae TaxID=2259034 RepID=UPI000FEBA2DF|nr:hypothetical protein [Streptomyces cavernae]
MVTPTGSRCHRYRWAGRPGTPVATGAKVVDIADTKGGGAARTALFQANGQKAAEVSFIGHARGAAGASTWGAEWLSSPLA